jgi:hypothetical protein
LFVAAAAVAHTGTESKKKTKVEMAILGCSGQAEHYFYCS